MRPAPLRPDVAWRRLEEAARAAEDRSIAELFDAEPERLATLVVEAPEIYLDLSKQPWSLAEFEIALDLARSGRAELDRDTNTARAFTLEAARHRHFAGEAVNASEDRAALHMALRAPRGADFRAKGEQVSAEIDQIRADIAAISTAIRSGEKRGATGEPFRAIVHIGIGGSDFGPRLVWEALRPLSPPIELRFAANVDPADMAQALDGLDPARTLVVVVSKTFTTLETISNAQVARAWLREALGQAGDAHLLAVSAAPDVAQAFGVPADQIFGFRDWVGGRYSVWSAVGLSCAIALGAEAFEELLAGGRAMDEHFLAAPLERNAPVLLALAHIFNRNGLGRPIRAVVPYAQRLRLLPNFLQQLEMESNGKQTTSGGAPVARGTAAAVFGDAGTNVQHAFFQLMHQGTDVIPVDILAVVRESEGEASNQPKLLANALAQAEALMVGKPEAEVRAELAAQGMAAEAIDVLAPQKTFHGNRPSSFILVERLTPRALGSLIALYEHKTFVEGVLWDINSFDQWGVELGKTLAVRILKELEGGPAGVHDPSTAALVARLKA